MMLSGVPRVGVSGEGPLSDGGDDGGGEVERWMG